jgi:4-amino-4-deoxy-L-arabinose transferase-like glycosyltransferase
MGRDGGLLARIRVSFAAHRAIALVIALALAARVGFIVVDGGYFPAHDAFDYVRHAVSIAGGDGYPESRYALDGGPSALRPPVYPYVLGGVFAVSGDSELAGRLASALLGVGAVVLLYLVTRRIWGRPTAVVAAALAAVFPPLVAIDTELLAEPLFIVLELAAVLCVLRFRGSGGELRWAVAAGALCGLGALTRNPGPILLIPIVVGVWTGRPRLGARALAAPALALVTAALVIAPWALRNQAEFGRFAPLTTSNGFALAGTYNPTSRADTQNPAAWRSPVFVPAYAPLFLTHGLDEGTIDATLRSRAVDFARQHPGYVAEATARNMLRLVEIEPGSVIGFGNRPVNQRGIGSGDPVGERIGLAIAALLALAGVATLAGVVAPAAGRRPARGPIFFWLVPLISLLATAPVAGLPRYRLPADPFLLVLAAIGLMALIGSARARGEATG